MPLIPYAGSPALHLYPSEEPRRRPKVPARVVLPPLLEVSWAPKGMPAPKRAGGSAARGLAYERAFGRFLRLRYAEGRSLHAGRWIGYRDRNGPGLAQPDFLLLGATSLPAAPDEPSSILILETKLTEVEDGDRQLRDLYAPLLSALYPGTTIRLLQVFKNWSKILRERAVRVTSIELGEVGPVSPVVMRMHWLP